MIPSEDYDSLPEVVKQYYSLNEYLWLTEEQKAKLVQTETEPDWEE
jgi:hypothetical protein